MTKTNYIVYSEVDSVELKKDVKWVSGKGDNVKFQTTPLGYFVLLKGSHECIFLGMEEPLLKPGDKVKITFERMD